MLPMSSIGDAAALQLGAVLTPRHRGRDGNKAQLKSRSGPTAPNETGNCYYIAPPGTLGICLPKNNSSQLSGNEKKIRLESLTTCLSFCHTCHDLDSQENKFFLSS